MVPKLIFYENTFGFCPLKKGCENCFVPPKCTGQNDKHVAFNLRKIKGEFVVTAIRNKRNA
jgi:hypothetical protein